MVSNHPQDEKQADLRQEANEKAIKSRRIARRQVCWSVAAVIGWVVLVSLLEIQHWRGVQHFAWVPAVLLMASLAITIPVALRYALHRLRRGPRRHRAFGWL